MRILISGASGLLGLNLALEAAKEHAVFGQVNSQRLETKAFTVIKADLLAPGSAERLIDQTQPDWVIHCAALADIDACEANPLQAEQLNTRLPSLLAEIVARGGARLLHVSTDAVFDGQRGDYSEADAPNPLGVYARTKLEAEHAVLQTNPNAIIARVNLYGWSINGKRSLAEFFYYNLAVRNSIKGFTDVNFCPLLANDLAQIFLNMLGSDLSGLYHVVSRQSISKFQFGVEIARKFSLDENLITPISVKEAGLKAARSSNLILRTDKLSSALGKSPPDIDDGLERFHALHLQGYPQMLKNLANPDHPT